MTVLAPTFAPPANLPPLPPADPAAPDPASLAGPADSATPAAPPDAPATTPIDASPPPAWRVLADALGQLQPDEVLSYARMAALLDLDLSDPSAVRQLRAVVRRATKHLFEDHKKIIVNSRGEGYKMAPPTQVLALARRDQGRAARAVHSAIGKVETIDTDALDTQTAALVGLMRTSFALQASQIRALDVRQDRLAGAIAAVHHKAHGAEMQATAALTTARDLGARLARVEQIIGNGALDDAAPSSLPAFTGG